MRFKVIARRFRRIVAPARPKPLMNSAQLAGSGTADMLPLKPLLPKSSTPQLLEMTLVSIVTAACKAIARPQPILDPVVIVML